MGHLHTHPSFLPISADVSSAVPSEEDISAFAEHYIRGELKPDEPFIFTIAALNPKGETEYAFYRLFKKGESFGYKHLD